MIKLGKIIRYDRNEIMLRKPIKMGLHIMTYSYGPATNLVIQATTLDTFLTGDVFTLKIYGKSQTNSFTISNSPFVIGSIFPTA